MVDRELGRMLVLMPKAKGTRGTGDANIGRGTGGDAMSPPVDDSPSYKSLGIEKKQASRWQQAASIEEDDFVNYIDKCKDKGEEITTKGLLSLARVAKREQTFAEAAKRTQVSTKGRFTLEHKDAEGWMAIAAMRLARVNRDGR